MVDLNQGFRYHYDEDLPNVEYVNMFYDGGWIYICNEHREGRIYRYHSDGIHDAIVYALRDARINETEANQYLELLAMIREGCRFPREFFIYNFDYEVLFTLDTWVMMHGDPRERVYEFPIALFDGESTIGTISNPSINAVDEFDYSTDNEDVFVQQEIVAIDMFNMTFDMEHEYDDVLDNDEASI
jgi:hypothetical protein